MYAPDVTYMKSHTMSSPFETCTPCADIAVLEVLKSKCADYLIQEFLSEGEFGKVARCEKLDTNELVAVKILKQLPKCDHMARREVSMLRKLSALDVDRFNIVQWYDHFVHRGHTCFVFEMLDGDLEMFRKEENYKPMPLSVIRPIVQQLATALQALKTIGVIHTDLKLDNIMFVNKKKQPLKIKLIDFGIAVSAELARRGGKFQPIAFRSPEVLLGLPITEAIDVWSLGCTMASMFLGRILYPGVSEYDTMRYIVDTQGQPKDYMLNAGLHTTKYFSRRYFSKNKWILKTPKQHEKKTGIASVDSRVYCPESLDKLMDFHEVTDEAELEDTLCFVDLLKKMFTIDYNQRITPSEVLEHPFLSLRHLVDHHADSYYTKVSVLAMSVCLPLDSPVRSAYMASPTLPEAPELRLHRKSISCGTADTTVAVACSQSTLANHHSGSQRSTQREAVPTQAGFPTSQVDIEPLEPPVARPEREKLLTAGWNGLATIGCGSPQSVQNEKVVVSVRAEKHKPKWRRARCLRLWRGLCSFFSKK